MERRGVVVVIGEEELTTLGEYDFIFQTRSNVHVVL